MPEEIIGNHRLLAEIGRGAMGIVYKAEQMSLGRLVALKVLHSHLGADPITVKRFNQEARAIALLNHPNIVQIHDVGVDKDRYFFAMEYFPGKTLASVLDGKKRLSPEEALGIADQVAAALSATHEVGITHRDIKPSNILIDDQGRVKVVDFGIAVAAGQGDLTDEGHLVGTARYMSPEHARSADLDGRSDIYSLGIVMYEMLMGSVPFYHEDSPLAVLAMHLTDPVPTMRGVPSLTEALVMTCLEKRPEDRPSSAIAFRKALREAAAEIRWQGKALPPLESAEDGSAHGSSFRYDRAGVIRSAVDTMTISLAGRLRLRRGLHGRVGRWLLYRLGRRLQNREDSYKLKCVEALQLEARLVHAEAQLEEAKRACDSACAKYETADAELHEWRLAGNRGTERDKQPSEEVADAQEKKLEQQVTSYKLQWQDIEAHVKELYAEVDRVRCEHVRAIEDRRLLRQVRERVAEKSGVARRNRIAVISCLALLTGAGSLWIVDRIMLHRGALDTEAPLVYGEFQGSGAMRVAREEHAAALLDDSSVLVAGGMDADKNALDSAEIFHRSTGEWTLTGKLCRARFNHTMTALPEGKGVVVMGGSQRYGRPDALDSVEKFVKGGFEEVSRLTCARTHHQSVLLSDGGVLVTGGSDVGGRPLDSAEILTPATNSVRLLPTRMKTARRHHAATALPNGRVVVTGGIRDLTPLRGVEVFDPVTEQFEEVCQLKSPRYQHTATAIDANRILVIGGRQRQDPATALDTIELVDIERRTSTIVGNLRMPRKGHTTVLLPGTPILLIVGGCIGDSGTGSMCEFYSLGWNQGRVAGQLSHDRNNHTATLLADGTVVFAGGYSQDTEHPLATTEVYVKVPVTRRSPLTSKLPDNQTMGNAP